MNVGTEVRLRVQEIAALNRIGDGLLAIAQAISATQPKPVNVRVVVEGTTETEHG